MTPADLAERARAHVPLVGRLAMRQAWRLATTGWVAAGAALLVSLSVLAVILGVRSVAVRHDRYEQLAQQVVQDQTRAPAPLSGMQIEPGLRVVREPIAASAVVRGLESSMPTYWDFSPSGPVPVSASDREDADTEVGPTLDLEFTVRVLAGLFAIALAFGTMRQTETTFVGLRSFPISAFALWAGLMIGVGIVVVATWGMVLAAVTGIAVLTTGSAAPIAVTAAALTVPSVFYLASMACLGSVFALSFRGEMWPYVAVFSVWLGATLLEPAVLGSIVRLLSPIRSSPAMIADRSGAYADVMRDAEFAMGERLVALEPSGSAPSKAEEEAHHRILEEDLQRHVRSARAAAALVQTTWETRRRRQDAERASLNWLNPASLFWAAATDLARTGTSDRDAWAAAIDRHALVLEQRLFDDRPAPSVRVQTPNGSEIQMFFRHAAPRASDLPAFDSAAPAAARAAGAWIAPSAGLLAYALLFGAISAALFCRRL